VIKIRTNDGLYMVVVGVSAFSAFSRFLPLLAFRVSPRPL
jgi:hypothetical protein